MPAGTVTAFDRERGLGEVTDGAGRVRPFHCIEIADASRDIAIGTAVAFGVLAKLGRYEATGITPHPAST